MRTKLRLTDTVFLIMLGVLALPAETTGCSKGVSSGVGNGASSTSSTSSSAGSGQGGGDTNGVGGGCTGFGGGSGQGCGVGGAPSSFAAGVGGGVASADGGADTAGCTTCNAWLSGASANNLCQSARMPANVVMECLCGFGPCGPSGACDPAVCMAASPSSQCLACLDSACSGAVATCKKN